MNASQTQARRIEAKMNRKDLSAKSVYTRVVSRLAVLALGSAALIACGADSLTTAGPRATPTAMPGQAITRVDITFYGFPDNSCQTEDQHSCNTIAFPKGAFPTRHTIATEATGTYDDPATYAGAGDGAGNGGPLKPGAIIYVPYLRKYFIMEDSCFECTQDWTRGYWHVDLWMGSNTINGGDAIVACENQLTVDDGVPGTGTIIVDPPPNLPVDTTKLFTNGATNGTGTCTAHRYAYH